MMDNWEEKMGNGEKMPALDVHQCGGEAQPFYICEQQRCWNEYGRMKDLWGSLKGLRKSTYAPPSLGGGGANVPRVW